MIYLVAIWLACAAVALAVIVPIISEIRKEHRCSKS